MASKTKDRQLGMPFGTASNKLKKAILFKLVKKCNLDNCFRCGKKIDSIEELTVDHIESWLNSSDPVSLFFNVENITFSHGSCNSGAAKSTNKGRFKHPSLSAYNKRGCRCEECCELNTEQLRKWREDKRKIKELI